MCFIRILGQSQILVLDVLQGRAPHIAAIVVHFVCEKKIRLDEVCRLRYSTPGELQDIVHMADLVSVRPKRHEKAERKVAGKKKNEGRKKDYGVFVKSH